MSIITPDPAAPGNQPPTGGVSDWRASLPEDLRSEKVFESIKGKDWSEAGPLLAKNYIHAQRLVGADKLILPTDKSTPEEIAAFRAKLGVPAKPEDYGWGKLPDGVTEDRLDKAKFAEWRKELHDAGIPKAAAERLISKRISEMHAEQTAAARARQDALTNGELQLKQEFGDKYDESVNFARWTAQEFGDEGLINLLESTGLGSNPDVVKLFAKIGRAMADDRARGSGSNRPTSTDNMRPEQAQMALSEFEASKENIEALHSRGHPRHDWAVQQRLKLFQAAYPAMAQE
jgi:cell fate (sporulation/competence/biofilm development) regulator YlbF (YheA/YmcA/DUF963 family)